jgi:antirestriction protein ArdC
MARFYMVNGEVIQMTPEEEAEWDATHQPKAPAVIDHETLNAALVEQGSVVRGLALVMLDELNQHAAQLNALRDVMVNASSLAAVRSAAQAITAYPARTVDQLKTAIKAKMR